MKALLTILFLFGISVLGEMKAFPSAEGFGAYSKGGRGGKVLFVTNLLDYSKGMKVIPGSLRAAVEEQGPRTVIFRVGGTIPLRSPLNIRQPFITIAGQTAPGGGICLRNFGINISTTDVNIRFLRIRPGDTIGKIKEKEGRKWDTDALSINKGSKRVIIDHCSMSWANDEVCSVSGEGIRDITIQWSFITESLNDSTHEKGPHGYGSLFRTNGNLTVHHNLYAFHKNRSPRPGTYGDGSILLDFRNNFMYMGGKGYTSKDPVRINFVGNFHPDTPFKATENCIFYTSDNDGTFTGGVNNKVEFKTVPVVTTPPLDAKNAILSDAGATRPLRDSVDKRLISLIQAKKGSIINSQSEVGGWPELKNSLSPVDSDNDGMPDNWEKDHKLKPGITDHNHDPDQDGYTNLEEFLNSTDPLSKN